MGRRHRKGRGQLSAFELMPREAAHIVAWASQELADRCRSQTDIYREFTEKCEALISDLGAAFNIPSFSAFNRHSIRQAELTRRMSETKALAAVLAEKYDADQSDELTIMTAEALKSLVFELQADGDLSPKNVLELSTSLKNLIQAQNTSAEARRKQQDEVNQKMAAAVDAVGKQKGMSIDTINAIKSEILGVQ